MFFSGQLDSKAQVSTGHALRHLLMFQLKLGADALRDLLLSPISVLVFLLDVVRKPNLEDSLYLKLMLLGRRSDRVVNLFDEHKDAGLYTIDNAVAELERIIVSSGKKRNAQKTSNS